MPGSNQPRWPEIAYSDWQDTCQTLQLWTQIVGKIRLRKSPWINHSWHVTLYVTPRGMTTGPIPDDDRQDGTGPRRLPAGLPAEYLRSCRAHC